MWEQFPTCLGGGPKRKKILKAGPTLFLACGVNIFPHGKIFLGFYVWPQNFLSKVKKIFPPKKKSRKNFTCDRHLINIYYDLRAAKPKRTLKQGG